MKLARAVLVVLVVIGVGCRRDDPSVRAPSIPVAAPGSAGTGSSTGSGTGSGTGTGSAIDPWAATGPTAPVEDTGMPSMLVTREIADAACPTVTGPYFFRIEKRGKTSHLLGTRHLGVDLAKMPAVVTERLTAARVAVFETAPDDTSAAPAAPHKPVDEELGPELWAHYQALMGDELATSLANEAPPTALLMMMALYEDKSSALDDQLQQVAIAAKIPVIGLETSAFQDRLIARWLDARALRSGVKVTENRAELRQDTIDDLTEYCAGTDDDPGPDPEERKEMLEGGYTEAEIATYEDELVFSRNRDWIPKLEKILAKGNAFIAVGADHLTGDRGVVALLGSRGYRVTRVTAP